MDEKNNVAVGVRKKDKRREAETETVSGRVPCRICKRASNLEFCLKVT